MRAIKLLFMDFLEQGLEKDHYPNNLTWYDRSRRIFRLCFKHKNSAAWKPSDAAICVGWDVYKDRTPSTCENKYYSAARHRVNSAIKKNVKDGCLKKIVDIGIPEEMGEENRYYMIVGSGSCQFNTDEGYQSSASSRDRSPIRNRCDFSNNSDESPRCSSEPIIKGEDPPSTEKTIFNSLEHVTLEEQPFKGSLFKDKKSGKLWFLNQDLKIPLPLTIDVELFQQYLEGNIQLSVIKSEPSSRLEFKKDLSLITSEEMDIVHKDPMFQTTILPCTPCLNINSNSGKDGSSQIPPEIGSGTLITTYNNNNNNITENHNESGISSPDI